YNSAPTPCKCNNGLSGICSDYDYACHINSSLACSPSTGPYGSVCVDARAPTPDSGCPCNPRYTTPCKCRTNTGALFNGTCATPDIYCYVGA
ncbi:unnamed protein product, partial [Rotaria sp. Silwood1]